jgi:hypothetical protein
MAIYDFYKSNYSQIAITVTSNEVLGILDTDYIEDYYGVDGQVTVYHPATDTRYPVLMTAIVPETQFRGYFQLTGKPLGQYQIQGKVRDKIGNVTVMGAIATGQIANAVELELFIREGEGNGSSDGILRLEGLDKEPLVFTFDYKPIVFKAKQRW